MFKVGDRVKVVDAHGGGEGMVTSISSCGQFFRINGAATGWPVKRLIRIATLPTHAKTRFSELPWDVVDEVCRVFMHGTDKYGAGNWHHQDNGGGDHVDAALRHIRDHLGGEACDAGEGGSGLRHLAHATARLMMALGKENRNGKS